MNAYITRCEPVLIWTGKAMLDGVLSVPQNALALVTIVGLGGTFHQERIRSIARHLEDHGFATLIADVLTADEQQFDSRTGHFRVDTPFIASRIREIVEWASTGEATEHLPVALFAGTTLANACVEAADDVSLFAIALAGPNVRVPATCTPALLVSAGMLDSDLEAEFAARGALKWFCEHVPTPVMA